MKPFPLKIVLQFKCRDDACPDVPGTRSGSRGGMILNLDAYPPQTDHGGHAGAIAETQKCRHDIDTSKKEPKIPANPTTTQVFGVVKKCDLMDY